MPASRRQELLGRAASIGAAIVEDDYDSEFHYDGRPVAALQGLDRNGCVFYVGTFSKAMFADIRVGYAIVPDNMVGIFERAQRHTGQIVAAPLQDALSEFIGEGHFAAHIRKMTRIYHRRRDGLVSALDAAVCDRLRLETPAGGMQLLAHLRPQDDDCAISAGLAKAGVTVRPLSRHFVGGIAAQGLFLGFAAWNEQETAAGVEIIGKMLRKPPGSMPSRNT
jgi:GntR family transcriptional regulator/MocR family aminotransferase